MGNKIIVFVVSGTSGLKEMLNDHMCVREFKHERKAGDPCFSESDFILYSLGRRYEGGFIDEVSVGCDNGEYEPILFDDFLGKVDEAIDIKPYFEELLSLGVEIFYFAERESSTERLKACGIPLEIYRREGI